MRQWRCMLFVWLSFLCGSSISFAQIVLPSTGVIGTVAGNGSFGSSGDGGAATSAVVNPIAVAVDTAGNVYIAETTYNAVRKISASTGIITTVAGTGAGTDSGDGGLATSAGVYGPSGIAVDGAGNIYIAEQDGHRLRKVTASTGIITTVAGNGSYGDSGDGGLAVNATVGTDAVTVDAAGNLYIATTDLGVVRKVTASSGVITTLAGVPNASSCYGGDGGPATSAYLCGPIGVGIDGFGNVYIVTYADSRVRKVTISNGIITTVAGNGTTGFSGDGGAATSAELGEPNGVAVDAAGDIYIADALNNRIRLVTASTGLMSTMAGDGPNDSLSGSFGGDGGPATSASLNNPVAVAVDTAGNTYIADDFNERVRVVGAGPVTGYVDPKFVVLAVAYAPPGVSSNVTYSANSVFGTNTSLANTLQSQAQYSTSVGVNVSIFGSGPNITATASSGFTQSQETTSAVGLSTSTTSTNEVRGPGSSTTGINHAYDVIYVWLNPKVSITTTSNSSKFIWNGYSWNNQDDADEMEVVPMYLTWLQNPSTIPTDVAARLARSWDPTLGGLTAADYAVIAARDPFASNPSYSPSSDTTGRFDLTGNTTFTYEPPPTGGQPITQTYALTYSTTSSQGQNATDQYMSSYAVDTKLSAGVNIGVFKSTISDDFKSTNTMTQTNQWSNTDNSSTQQGATLSITGPQTSDGYTGPTQMQVWKDNVYGTFMFYPLQ